MPRQTLGRGLSALLGEESSSPADANSFEIDIDLIDPNPEQPRTRFAEESLDELALSIRANGVVQPIVVRKFGSRYQIIAGERRWRASQRAEQRRIPVVVRDVPDEKLLELALVENIQRRELNPIEEANAYRNLIDKVGLTQELLSERVGKERSVIATMMRLLRLPRDIQRSIEDGRISAGHGRALLTTDDPKIQRAIANSIVDNGWSVRATEKAVKTFGRTVPKEAKAATGGKDPNVKLAETKLMRKLSTNVKIVAGKKGSGGKIEIEYYGTDDLDRLFQLLMNK